LKKSGNEKLQSPAFRIFCKRSKLGLRGFSGFGFLEILRNQFFLETAKPEFSKNIGFRVFGFWRFLLVVFLTTRPAGRTAPGLKIPVARRRL
jgi:hypothetical protein